MKKPRERKPSIHKSGPDHDQERNDDPEKNSSENDSRQSLGFTVFALRPFLVPVHAPFGLTEASLLLSVSSRVHPGGRSRIENGVF
jgi:hypothetical protein